MAKTVLTLKTDVKKMMFSMNNCLRFDAGAEDRRYLLSLAEYLIGQSAKCAFFGTGDICYYFLNLAPQLKNFVSVVISYDLDMHNMNIHGIPVVALKDIPQDVKTVFLCSAHWRDIARMKKSLPSDVKTVTLDALKDINSSVVPSRAWAPKFDNIYPINIPEIEFLPDQDVILLDFPARSLGQMPVGFGYVHDALTKEGIKLQTMDLDIILYHIYHADRLLDGIPAVKTPAGRTLPEDPWLPVHYLEWEKPDTIDFFRPQIDEIVKKLCKAKPKILACSLQQANLSFAREVVSRVRKGYPDVIVLVGGMSCLQPDAAKIVFPLADYTIVGEADLCVGPLVKTLLKGDKPRDLIGIWSRYDTQGREFKPGRPPENLDALGHPHYEWTDLQLYRNWNGYSLTPIVGSRGCSWSRCRFCAERFNWRIRTPEKVVDDLEFFHKNGFVEFVFNESDLHGNPKIIDKMCEEIIRRKLNIRMTAQLRCNKNADKQYYKKLAKAGFVCLRFGMDAGSENVLKLQMKGTTKEIIRNNLKDATESGIYTEVNIVVGIPGETEGDIDETIEFLTELKPYIGRVAFINPLMLFRGSEYWENSDTHGIKFKIDKDKLYKKYPVAIPDWAWYSINPFIDVETRYQRYHKIVRALKKNGVSIGDWANFMTDEVMKKEIDVASMYNATEIWEKAIANDADFDSDYHEPDTDTSRPDVKKMVSSLGTATTEPLSATFLYNYKDYKFFLYNGLVYSVPVFLENINFSDERSRTQPGIIMAETEAQAKRTVNNALQAQEDSNSYIVFSKEGQILGIPKDSGTSSVLGLIHEPNTSTTPPKLVCGVDIFNIVSYDDFFYAVPRSLGPLDLTRKQDRERPGIIVAFTESEARSRIESILRKSKQFVGSEDTPTLLTSYKDFNLVRYQGQVLGVPISLGPLDLRDENSRKSPGIFFADNESSVKTQIDNSLKKNPKGSFLQRLLE